MTVPLLPRPTITVSHYIKAKQSHGVTFAALFGFTLTVMGVGIQTMGQIAVDDGMRGRVMILYVMIYRGLPAIGSLLIGIMAEWIGLRSAFAFSALACVLTWLALATRHRAIEEALAKGRAATDGDGAPTRR